MSEQQLIEVKTIGEVERIVHGSGQWDGTGPVEFSNDGESWRETWAPTDTHPYPEYARVSVYRKDVRIPTTVTIRWDEQVPRNDEFWAAKWVGAPMRHFGRTARMVGFRQTFRELLGNIVLEDEDRTDRPAAQPAPDPAARDWDAEITGADTADELDAVEKDARAARIFTPDATGTALHRALRARRRELTTAARTWDTTDEPAPAPAPQPVPRPKPRDYLPPQNRADRRATARKKGRRR